jgi:hypothetical protein
VLAASGKVRSAYAERQHPHDGRSEQDPVHGLTSGIHQEARTLPRCGGSRGSFLHADRVRQSPVRIPEWLLADSPSPAPVESQQIIPAGTRI